MPLPALNSGFGRVRRHYPAPVRDPAELYENLRKGELVELARGRDLQVSGTKSDLIARLVEDDKTRKAGPVQPVAEVEKAPPLETDPEAETEGSDTESQE